MFADIILSPANAVLQTYKDTFLKVKCQYGSLKLDKVAIRL